MLTAAVWKQQPRRRIVWRVRRTTLRQTAIGHPRGHMQSSRLALLAIPLLLSGTAKPRADCGRLLSRLEGWTIVKAGSINGTFNGCDFDKLIEFTDGTALRCSSYGYQYAYMPDAIVLAKTVTIQGSSATMVKMLVEGELSDMQPLR